MTYHRCTALQKTGFVCAWVGWVRGGSACSCACRTGRAPGGRNEGMGQTVFPVNGDDLEEASS